MIPNRFNADQSAVGSQHGTHDARTDALEIVRYHGSRLRDSGGTLLEIG